MNAFISNAVAGVDHPGGLKTLDQPGSSPPATGLRVAARTLAILFFSFCALIESALTILFLPSAERLQARAEWLHRWCRLARRILGIRLTTHGAMPETGLLICNHLSYLDIIVLSSVRPCIFVAKSDVANWPLFGWLARAAGSIFADRRNRRDVARVAVQMRNAIQAGILVVLFPEGTSSDGATVLSFKPSLLEPAVQLRCQTTAASIDYFLQKGSVADEVCYWRDMTLLPHLLNLFSKANIESKLSIASYEPRERDRKTIARELHQQVASMRSP